MKPIIAIQNLETEEVITREMTDEEFKEYEQERKAIEAKNKELAKIEAARHSAIEKLAALGLTEDEIKAIAG